jgi:hypothetical protein
MLLFTRPSILTLKNSRKNLTLYQKKVKEKELLCQAKRYMLGKKIDLSKDSGQKAILQLFMQR